MTTNRFAFGTVAVLAGALCSAATVAHAAPVQIINKKDWLVQLVYASPDSGCESGLREHTVDVSANETKFIDVNTSGIFLLAGRYLDYGSSPEAPVDVAYMNSKFTVNHSDFWLPQSDGACAQVTWGGGSTISHGVWFDDYNLNNFCGTVGGVLGIEITNESRPRVGAVCFVNGPDGEPVGEEGGSPD